MILQKIMLAAIVAAVFTVTALPSSASIVQFDFNNGGVAGAAAGAFDPGEVGDTATVAGLTATLIGVTAPEYEIPAGETIPVLTGNTLSGGDVVTNISGQQALGIQNPSISNNAFDLIGGGTESSDINVGESFTFTFDQDVVFTEIELESVVATDGFEVLVDGVSVLATLGDDSFLDSLGGLAGLTIDAGSAITFSANEGDVTTSSFRIETFTVDVISAVPEPSSLALLGLAGLGLVARRRR